MEKFDLGLDPIFGPTFVYAGRAFAPKFKPVRLRLSLGFAPPYVRAQERVFLLVVLPITRWVTIYIHLLAYINSQYGISFFHFTIFNSMGLF